MAGTRSPTSTDPQTPRVIEDSSFALLRDNVSEALRILMLRRWSFFVPFCLVTCIAAIASHRVTRIYESQTVIERRDHPVLMNLQQTAATGGFAMFFRPTLARDVRDVEAMAEVVENLELASKLERKSDGTLTPESHKKCLDAGAALANGVKVSLNQKGEHFDQIEIAYSSSDLSMPQRLVEEISKVYIARTRHRLTEMLTDVTGYFRQLADTQWERKGKLEEDLLTFQANYIGVDPTDPGSLQMKLNSLETERAELVRTIDSLGREIVMRTHLRDQYSNRAKQNSATTGVPNAPNIARSAETVEIEKEIREIQHTVHELQLTRRMTDQHPDIIEQRKRIDLLQQRLGEQYRIDAERIEANKGLVLTDDVADAAVDAIAGWSAETAAIQMQIQDREAQLGAAQTRLRIVESEAAKHEQVLANVFKYRKEYLFKKDNITQAVEEYHRAMERVALAEGVLNADESERGMTFTELTPPTPCVRPIHPKSTTVLALSLLVGFAAGAIGVLLKELFDHTYRTSKQVTRSLGLGILESVDEIITSSDRARRFRRKVFYSPVAILVLGAGVFLTCAAAYLSVEHPSRFDKMMHGPRALISRAQQKWFTSAVDEGITQEPIADASLDALTDQEFQIADMYPFESWIRTEPEFQVERHIRSMAPPGITAQDGRRTAPKNTSIASEQSKDASLASR